MAPSYINTRETERFNATWRSMCFTALVNKFVIISQEDESQKRFFDGIRALCENNVLSYMKSC